MITDIEALQIMKAWYYRADVKFKIIKYLYNREFALLVPKHFSQISERSLRDSRVHNVQGLDYILWHFCHTLKKNTPYNLYYSMAKYKNGIPIFDVHDNILRKTQKSSWRERLTSEIISYDWLIDIDSPTIEDLKFAYDDTKIIKDILDKCIIPYELKFSGKGFHFVIPYRIFEKYGYSFNPIDENSIYKFYIKLGKILNNRYSELIDYTIIDSRRLCKLPYSLAIYPNNVFVAYPFNSIEEFNNFKLDNAIPSNIPNLRDRDVYTFNNEGINADLLIEYLGDEIK